jgi:hypothetical protein
MNEILRGLRSSISSSSRSYTGSSHRFWGMTSLRPAPLPLQAAPTAAATAGPPAGHRRIVGGGLAVRGAMTVSVLKYDFRVGTTSYEPA